MSTAGCYSLRNRQGAAAGCYSTRCWQEPTAAAVGGAGLRAGLCSLHSWQGITPGCCSLHSRHGTTAGNSSLCNWQGRCCRQMQAAMACAAGTVLLQDAQLAGCYSLRSWQGAVAGGYSLHSRQGGAADSSSLGSWQGPTAGCCDVLARCRCRLLQLAQLAWCSCGLRCATAGCCILCSRQGAGTGRSSMCSCKAPAGCCSLSRW